MCGCVSSCVRECVCVLVCVDVCVCICTCVRVRKKGLTKLMTYPSSLRLPTYCEVSLHVGFRFYKFTYIYARDSSRWHDRDGNEVAARRGGRKPPFFIIIIFFNSQVFEFIEILQWKLFPSFLLTRTHTQLFVAEPNLENFELTLTGMKINIPIPQLLFERSLDGHIILWSFLFQITYV